MQNINLVHVNLRCVICPNQINLINLPGLMRKREKNKKKKNRPLNLTDPFTKHKFEHKVSYK